MIELSDEQRQELTDSGEPARARDPVTNTEYVLVRADLYARLRELLEEDEDRQEQAAFLRASHASAVALMKENPY